LVPYIPCECIANPLEPEPEQSDGKAFGSPEYSFSAQEIPVPTQKKLLNSEFLQKVSEYM